MVEVDAYRQGFTTFDLLKRTLLATNKTYSLKGKSIKNAMRLLVTYLLLALPSALSAQTNFRFSDSIMLPVLKGQYNLFCIKVSFIIASKVTN
jgi:hypothetical protein